MTLKELASMLNDILATHPELSDTLVYIDSRMLTSVEAHSDSIELE